MTIKKGVDTKNEIYSNKIQTKDRIHKLYRNGTLLGIQSDPKGIRLKENYIGHLNKNDYDSVLENMTLCNGKVWSIPIVLPVEENKYNVGLISSLDSSQGQKIWICFICFASRETHFTRMS